MTNRGRFVRRIVLLAFLISIVTITTRYVLGKVDEAHAIQATAEAARICYAVLNSKAKDCSAATAYFDTDPWGRPYKCEMIGPQQARITCLGKDGLRGGDGYDFDHVCEPEVVGDEKHCFCHFVHAR